MTDTTLAAGVASADSPISVELIANNSSLLFGQKAILLSGQNLKRGALVGRITASGKYVLSLSASSDGSQVPLAVLVHDTDATAGDTETLVYQRGDFNQAAMTFGTGQTPDSVRDALRDAGIFLHKPYGVA
ncbi:hypothetical protein BH11PSE13_BH11PSE13_12220 [soil metagenome]